MRRAALLPHARRSSGSGLHRGARARRSRRGAHAANATSRRSALPVQLKTCVAPRIWRRGEAEPAPGRIAPNGSDVMVIILLVILGYVTLGVTVMCQAWRITRLKEELSAARQEYARLLGYVRYPLETGVRNCTRTVMTTRPMRSLPPAHT